MEIYKAVGCAACNKTGYKGRTGVHELLVPNDELRKAINKPNITSDELKEIAMKTDMTSLYWDAIEKVHDGVTSLEEVFAKVRQDSFETRPKWMREQDRSY